MHKARRRRPAGLAAKNRRQHMQVDFKAKFAEQRETFLIEMDPDTYQVLKQRGELIGHLQANARQAVEVLDHILATYQPELDAMQERQARNARRQELVAMAETAVACLITKVL